MKLRDTMLEDKYQQRFLVLPGAFAWNDQISATTRTVKFSVRLPLQSLRNKCAQNFGHYPITYLKLSEKRTNKPRIYHEQDN